MVWLVWDACGRRKRETHLKGELYNLAVPDVGVLEHALQLTAAHLNINAVNTQLHSKLQLLVRVHGLHHGKHQLRSHRHHSLHPLVPESSRLASRENLGILSLNLNGQQHVVKPRVLHRKHELFKVGGLDKLAAILKLIII